MASGAPQYGTAEIPFTFLGMINPTGESVNDQLQASTADIIDRIDRQLHDTVYRVLLSPSAEKFDATRRAQFPKFMRLYRASVDIICANIDLDDLSFWVEASFKRLEHQLGAILSSYFDDKTCQDILFSVSTLKNANRLVPRLISEMPLPEHREEDSETARKYNVAMMWSEFHLRALKILIRKEQAVIPEILSQLLKGLRASVDAYALARSALEFRQSFVEQYSHSVSSEPITEEDNAWINFD